MTLQEGCNKILVSDCFTLLERQFHNLSRGLYSHKETQCGAGCGGRIVVRPTTQDQQTQESSIYSDTFVFNCKHAFHIECLPADDHHNNKEESTNCPLCTSSKKRRFWKRPKIHFWHWSFEKFWPFFEPKIRRILNSFSYCAILEIIKYLGVFLPEILNIIILF